MFGVHVTIHLEPDGSGHAFFDTGDWDHEILYPEAAMTLEQIRTRALDWVAGLPFGDETDPQPIGQRGPCGRKAPPRPGLKPHQGRGGGDV